MRTITVHCFNDDGYSYEFEMQVAIVKMTIKEFRRSIL